MAWIYFILTVLFFIHFFKSINTSILIIRAGKINRYPKVLNIVLVWIVPIYWDNRVRRQIEKEREIVTDHSMDLPQEMTWTDILDED